MIRKSLKNKKPLAVFKRRHFFPRVNRGLIWGTSGALLLTRACLVVSAVYWMKIRIKWHYKKKTFQYRKHGTKGRRTYWHRVRSYLPCTRKPEKSRMGKGKGKLAGLFTNLNAGFFLFEFRMTKKELVTKLIKYLNSKMGARLQLVIANARRPIQSFGSKDVNFSIFRSKYDLYNKRKKRQHNFCTTRTDLQYY